MSRRQLRDTAAYTLLNLFPVAIGFVLLPVYTQFLPVEEYGLIVLANITQAFLVLVVGLAFDRAILRLLFDAPPGSPQRHRLLGQIFSATLLFAFVVGILLFFAGPDLFDLVWDGRFPFQQFGWVVFLTAFFSVVNLTLFQYYRTEERLVPAFVVSLFPYVLALGGSIAGIVIFSGGALESLIGKAIGLSLGTLPLWLILLRRTGLPWQSSLFKELLSYSFPLFLFGLVFLAGESIDRVLLNRVLPFRELSLYGFALTVTLPSTLLLVGYNHAAQPAVVRELALGTLQGPERAQKFFTDLSALALLSFWAFLGAAFPLIDWMAKPDYQLAKVHLPLLALMVFGRAGEMIATFYQLQEKRTRMLPVAQGLYLLLVIGLILWLAPRMGTIGVSLAIALAQAPSILFRLIFERRVTRQHASLTPLFSVFGFSAAMLVLNEFVFVRQWGLSQAWVQGCEALAVMLYLAYRYRTVLATWMGRQR